MALNTLYPAESHWGVRPNEQVYDGYLRVGNWRTIDPAHPNQNTLGKSTGIIEFDLSNMPRGLSISSAILFVDRVSETGSHPGVTVYGYNRKTGNPSDLLGLPLSSFSRLGGPFRDADIILDATGFIRSTYNAMGMNSPAPVDSEWIGADFILAGAPRIPGYRTYVSGMMRNIAGSPPSLWVTGS